MYRYLAPALVLLVFLLVLETMPLAWAQTVVAPSDVADDLATIPIVGDIIVQIQRWLPVIFQIVGVFAMIAAMTANETDDKIVNVILKIINFVGMNFGTAKNDPTVGVSRNDTTGQQ